MSSYFLMSSLALYVIACNFTAYQGEQASIKYSGGVCLMIGWIALFYNWKLFLAWLANIPYLIAGWMFWYNQSQLIIVSLLVVAILLGLWAFTAQKLLVNEGGTETTVTSRLAIYVWLASFVVLFIGTWFVK